MIKHDSTLNEQSRGVSPRHLILERTKDKETDRKDTRGGEGGREKERDIYKYILSDSKAWLPDGM